MVAFSVSNPSLKLLFIYHCFFIVLAEHNEHLYSNVAGPELRLAKVKVDDDFTAPCNPSILYPEDGGNLHCFTAVTACAVLDVLGPPYSDFDGRHCTYYTNYPFSNFPGKFFSNTDILFDFIP